MISSLTLHPLVAATEALRLEPESVPIIVGRADEGIGAHAAILADGSLPPLLLIRDNTVSKAHATLDHQGGEWTVENGNPMNGTFVDLIPLAAGERTPLFHGGMIEFGGAAFLVQLGDLHQIEARPFNVPIDDPISEDERTRPIETRVGVIRGACAESTKLRERAWHSLSDRCNRLADLYQGSICAHRHVDAGTYEDAKQEALVRVHRLFELHGQDGFKPELGRFRTLFRVILANRLSSLIKKKRPDPVDGASLIIAAEDRELIRLMLQEEIQDALARVKRKASPKQWEVFRLRVLEGLSSQDAAKRTGCTVANVNRIVCDLRKLIRRLDPE